MNIFVASLKNFCPTLKRSVLKSVAQREQNVLIEHGFFLYGIICPNYVLGIHVLFYFWGAFSLVSMQKLSEQLCMRNEIFQDNHDKCLQNHAYRCPGSLCRQVISMYAICSCHPLPCVRILTACVVPKHFLKCEIRFPINYHVQGVLKYMHANKMYFCPFDIILRCSRHDTITSPEQ